MPVTILDAIVLIFILISATLAMVRGFVRELLSVDAVVAAAAAAYYFYGPIVPLETQTISPERYVVERHLCIDTTAAGGNASLLAASE